MSYTPEGYTLMTWVGFERMHTGEGFLEPKAPAPEPHPNEVATRAAVKARKYKARDVGI